MGTILFRVNVTREFPPLPSPLISKHWNAQKSYYWWRGLNENFSDTTRKQNLLAKHRVLPRPRLREKLADAEAFLKGLIRKQLSLEEDIEVKAKSIFIYRDQCMELRKQVNHLITSLKELF